MTQKHNIKQKGQTQRYISFNSIYKKFKIGELNQWCWKSALGRWGGVIIPRDYWGAGNVS